MEHLKKNHYIEKDKIINYSRDLGNCKDCCVIMKNIKGHELQIYRKIIKYRILHFFIFYRSTSRL